MTIEHYIFWGVQLAVGTLLGLVAYFLKGAKDSADRSVETIEKSVRELEKQVSDRLNKLERDVMEMKANMPLVYVFREDYIRTMASFGNKLDKVLESGVLHRGEGKM